MQCPCPSQASPVVHALPSSHGSPLLLGTYSHWPFTQLSIVHVRPSLQTIWLPAQVPFEQ